MITKHFELGLTSKDNQVQYALDLSNLTNVLSVVSAVTVIFVDIKSIRNVLCTPISKFCYSNTYR